MKAQQQDPKGLISQLDESKMNDQQKEDLEEYVMTGYRLIYDKGKSILKMASRDAKTKVKSVAEAGYLVAKRLDAMRIDNDEPPFPDVIKAVGGHHLINKIIDFSEAAGTKPFSEPERKAALQTAMQKYMEDGIKNRTIDPFQLAVGAEQVQPGSMSSALAALPDDKAKGQPTQGQQQAPSGQGQGQQQAPSGQEQQAAPAKQGLLTQPSPLERFING